MCIPQNWHFARHSAKLGDDGIKEIFRNLPKPDSCAEQKIWTIIDDDVENA